MNFSALGWSSSPAIQDFLRVTFEEDWLNRAAPQIIGRTWRRIVELDRFEPLVNSKPENCISIYYLAHPRGRGPG